LVRCLARNEAAMSPTGTPVAVMDVPGAQVEQSGYPMARLTVITGRP
jgi:hypothetical protein